MKSLRRWELNATAPFEANLAADARLSRTDYADDQSWQLDIGAMGEPALALHTQYGGRVGLASIVPMWQIDHRVIYEWQAYNEPPVITRFAPDLIQIEGQLLPEVALTGLFWAMESHAVGGMYTLENSGGQPVKLRLDLFGHVVAQEKSQRLSIITMEDQKNALHMGQVGNLNPVVILENADAQMSETGRAASPKIGTDLAIPAKGSVTIRWVHAGLPNMLDALNLARFWLKEKWSSYFEQIERASLAIPTIQTGNKDWDATIAASYNRLVQAFLQPGGRLPHASFVATRTPPYGYSPRGDGSDHGRHWSGQEPTTAYLVASAMATVDPALAKGIIQNYLAVQSQDGWIDRKPGYVGQMQDLMVMPVLARLTWNIYEATEDEAFLSAAFPGLLKYFERWFGHDLDADQDGIPEWQVDRQTGDMLVPTFAVGQTWSQGASIRYMETPDMVAYLLSEADSLLKMAQVLESKASANRLEKRLESLEKALAELWNSERFVYRDRDVHATPTGIILLEKVPGDEEYTFNEPLDPANRLLIRVIGGVRHEPRITLHVEGANAEGQRVEETAETKAFVWQNGQGLYTTKTAFSQVKRIYCEGLSRVYRISAETVDATGLDINALLPLFSRRIPAEQAEKVVKLVRDKKHFWLPNGVPVVSAQDPRYDPTSVDGGGGIWPYWLTLIGEGLIDTGHADVVGDMLKDFLKMQADVLMETGHFYEFYHSSRASGHGATGHLDGITPLFLLLRTMGIRITSNAKVWVGGDFGWDRSVTVRQHGVAVRRTKKSIKVSFPSGHQVELPPDAAWQAVIDPKPSQQKAVNPVKSSPPKKKPTSNPSKTVIIEVDVEE